MPFNPADNPTPFGIFDLDLQFQVEADHLVDFTRRKLGDPVMETYISSSQIYAALEEACLEYSAIINSYQAKSTMTAFLGSATGSLSGSENTYVTNVTMEYEKKMSEQYGNSGPLTVNTSIPLLSGTIDLQVGVQKYNLNTLFSSSIAANGGRRLDIKEVFHFSPMSAYRFFGTTSAINYMNSQFNFESFTPETVFYLLPIWEDILRGMQFKTSNNVRRSNYSYTIHANELTLYPAPTQNLPLWISWQFPPDPTQPVPVNGLSGSIDQTRFGVANLSNIPFGNIKYSNLNSISQQWIRRFAFALAKEIEGLIRQKMGTIPIPDGDLTLDGPNLVSDSRGEQDRLREELRGILDEMTYDKLIAKQAEKAQALEETLKRVPLPIYIF